MPAKKQQASPHICPIMQRWCEIYGLAGKPTCSAYYFFMVVVIIRYETTAAARWALLFIVRTFFNDAFTVAVWTSFHTCLMSS